ncbi:MAG TPA: AraC family transcriptional regulator [Kiritimatiellia bacterium]|nr:AraC family transcriptional regulator [Kiritimatiellia bacterium]
MKLKAEKIHLLPDESFRLLSWQNNLHDVEIVAPDGTHRPISGSGHEWHHHSQFELTLVTKGSGTRFIGDSITHFNAPDIVLIGSDLPHYWHMRQHSSGFALQFDFSDDHPLGKFPETTELRACLKDARRGLHVTGESVTALTEFIRSSLTCGGMARLANFLKILDRLTKVPSKHRKPISSMVFTPPARQATYVSLQKAINLVFASFQEPLRFSDVLREAHMSKATFERHFRKHTGKTYTQFVSEVRLNFASRQLIETDLPIGELALEAGFSNLSHFNHQFKALYRLTPRAFRNKMAPDTGQVYWP